MLALLGLAILNSCQWLDFNWLRERVQELFSQVISTYRARGKYVCPRNSMSVYFSSLVYILGLAPVMESNMCAASIYCKIYHKSCLLLAISQVVLLAAIAVWTILTLT
jgi:hypothetical protein